jgi:hypothetical protein
VTWQCFFDVVDVDITTQSSDDSRDYSYFLNHKSKKKKKKKKKSISPAWSEIHRGLEIVG